jgi:hypothetical protein
VLALYSTDRYYYFFLLPSVVTFVLLAEPLLNSVRTSLARRASRASRSTGVVLLVAAAGGLIGLSRQAMNTRIPWQLMEQSKSALEKGRTLVRTVEREVKALGNSTDSQLVEVAVPLIGAHKGVLHLSSAIYAEHPSGIGGIRLTHQPLGPLDEATENRIFARWASGVGLARSPIEVAGGIATPSPVGNWIDFREVSVPDDVVSGFHQPEAGLRWTKANAEVVLDPVPTELSLILWAPVDDLRRGNPSIDEIRVRVLVDGRDVGCTVLRSSAPVTSCFPLSVTGSANRSKATVRLQVEPTWQPIRYLGMADTRDLGVAVVAIGGQPGTMPPCRHVSCDEPPARP